MRCSRSRSQATLLVLLLLPLSLLATACPRFAKPDDAVSLPSDAIAAVEARSASVNDLRLVTKADYWDFEHNERVAGRDVVISARQPASLRLTLSSFDKALATLVSDGTMFYMVDTNEAAYYTGPATPAALSQLLPLYLSSADFVRVLSGGFPQDELASDWRQRAVLDWNDDEGRYRLVLPRQDGGSLVVELEYPSFATAYLAIRNAEGDEVYVYRAKDFTAVGSTSLPSVCRFEMVEREVDVTLRIEKADVNLSLQDKVFELPIPPGFTVVPVSGD